MFSIIKKAVLNNSVTGDFYKLLRQLYHHLKKMAYIVYDAKAVFRFMRWRGSRETRYWAASAELLFQYHKLEKGLSMPGEARFFGAQPAAETLFLLKSWEQKGFNSLDNIYLGAIETLRSYYNKVRIDFPGREPALIANIEKYLAGHGQVNEGLSTPIATPTKLTEHSYESLLEIIGARRSVRSFSQKNIPLQDIKKAISLAQQSPSACNRQPCRVHVYDNRQKIDALLHFQNGNRGFGHLIPMLLIITAEQSCFFDASERHEPYVDGGLFAMSLILAMQSQNISSCCLNWCVAPNDDRKAHVEGNIPESEKIIMFMAVGYSDEGARVPRSPRRDQDSILVIH